LEAIRRLLKGPGEIPDLSGQVHTAGPEQRPCPVRPPELSLGASSSERSVRKEPGADQAMRPAVSPAAALPERPVPDVRRSRSDVEAPGHDRLAALKERLAAKLHVRSSDADSSVRSGTPTPVTSPAEDSRP
jgi:hypothetical protein